MPDNDIVKKLEDCIEVAAEMEKQIQVLIDKVTVLEPAHNTIQSMLLNVGFGRETTNEDNLKLLLDHHTDMVAENTQLRKTITNRDALMEQLREVVLADAD